MIHFGGTGVGWWDQISGKRIPIPLCQKNKTKKHFSLAILFILLYNPPLYPIFYFTIHYIKIILYFNVHKQVESCRKKKKKLAQCYIGYVNIHDTVASCTLKKKIALQNVLPDAWFVCVCVFLKCYLFSFLFLGILE